MSEPEAGSVSGTGVSDPHPTNKREYSYQDGRKDAYSNFLRRTFFDPVTFGLIIATMGLPAWGVLRAASNPNDESILTGFLIIATVVLPTTFSVLSVLWKEPADKAIMVALVRTFIVPLVAAWPPVIVVVITASLPAVRQMVAGAERDDGWRGLFSSAFMSLLGEAAVIVGLVGVLLALLTGLVLSVFVVLPILAWFRPLGAAKSNLLLTKAPEEQAAAKAGIRMLSVILMMTFGVPVLIFFGRSESLANSWVEAFSNVPLFFVEPGYYYGDLVWVLGMLAIPFGIYLIFKLKRVQRPDIAKRAQYGVNSAEDQLTWLESQRAGDGARGDQPEADAQSEPK